MSNIPIKGELFEMVLIDIVENEKILKRYYIQSAIADKISKNVSFFDGKNWRSIHSKNIKSISFDENKIILKI